MSFATLCLTLVHVFSTGLGQLSVESFGILRLPAKEQKARAAFLFLNVFD